MSRYEAKTSGRGYFSIGVQNPKTSTNYGTLFRTATIFNAAYIFTIGARFTPQTSDTMRSERHMPAISFTDFDDFNKHRPHSCPLIGVELIDSAIPLAKFSHPQRCIYLLGAEDSGLSNEAIKHCQQIIKFPGDYSLNVAVAGSIVLYDRITR